jgi:hypothetical protein
MKQAIISAAIGASRWLHGEGSKHFRTYTYPRIKKFTRRFVNLGLYEFIERGYKIVDDTFYQGAIEPLDPERQELTKLGESILAAQEKYPDYGLTDSAVSLPRFEDIADDLIIWKGLEQGNTYRCGTFAMNNMLRTAMIRKGLRPPLEVTAIDPLYIFTKAGKGKEGTVMANAFRWLAQNGFPIASWTPSMTNHDKELDQLERDRSVDNAKIFSTIRATGNSRFTYKYDEAVELDRTLPMSYEMQVSIDFNRSLKYFGQKVPFLQAVNGKFDLTRTGGHAIHGVRGSFSKWEDGEEGFAIIESAYRSSEDGLRFLKKKLMDYGMITIRFVEFNVGTETVTPKPTPVPTPTPNPTPTPVPGTTFPFVRLAGVDTQFGESNNNVKLLQEYLISQGFPIAAGATSYFGEQTREALKAWQDRHFPGNTYSGGFWGEISRRKFIELHNLG